MKKSFLKCLILFPVIAPSCASAAPVLQMAVKGKNVELKWPADSGGWYAQASASLQPGSWGPMFQDPVLMNGSHILTCPMAGNTQRFFRLAKSDMPDGLNKDENGDGIDGDINRAIFVTATGGNDSNPGTMALPMATLPAAISRASQQRRDVYVGKGTHSPGGLLVLSSGVSLYGQYDPAKNWARSAENITTISGGVTGVVAQSITEETHLEGFTIKSANASLPGSSSYGVRVLASSGPIYLRHNRIIAGNGADGGAGKDGIKGRDGGDGFSGTDGYPDNDKYSGSGGYGGSSPAGRNGGAGGKGGLAPSYRGAAGGAGTGGAQGGSGGGPGDPGKAGNDGADGASGTAHPAGAGGKEFGAVSISGYTPASGSASLAGTHGHGGGGGGGGGGQDCAFCDNGGGNGGGGGGGGGEAGTGGGGGSGGGGSFGILSHSSMVMISGCHITTGKGGTGGKGGNGGLGGAGGTQGWGAIKGILENELKEGGSGGRGGDGGAGGNGGGGGGGPSVGIARAGGGSSGILATSYAIGAGGMGGAGGVNGNQSNAGAQGVSAEVR